MGVPRFPGEDQLRWTWAKTTVGTYRSPGYKGFRQPYLLIVLLRRLAVTSSQSPNVRGSNRLEVLSWLEYRLRSCLLFGH